MKFSVFLQDPFDYAPYWLWWGLGLLAAAVLVRLLCRYLPRLRIRVTFGGGSLLRRLRLFFQKRRSLRRFRKIENAVRKEALDPRSAHQNICRELRLFARAATGLPTESMVYSELAETPYPKLASLIGEFYAPEFSARSEEDVGRLLNLSKELVHTWR